MWWIFTKDDALLHGRWRPKVIPWMCYARRYIFLCITFLAFVNHEKCVTSVNLTECLCKLFFSQVHIWRKSSLLLHDLIQAVEKLFASVWFFSNEQEKCYSKNANLSSPFFFFQINCNQFALSHSFSCRQSKKSSICWKSSKLNDNLKEKCRSEHSVRHYFFLLQNDALKKTKLCYDTLYSYTSE